MVTRLKLFRCSALLIGIGLTTAVANPTATPKPARGTLEYAKKHVLYAPRPVLSTGDSSETLNRDGAIRATRTTRWHGLGSGGSKVQGMTNWTQFQLLRCISGAYIPDNSRLLGFRPPTPIAIGDSV